MVAKDFESGFDGASDDDEDSELDLDRVLELVGFAKRAPRRHPRLAIGLLFAGLALTAASVVLIPRTYTTEVKLLAQRNFVIPALGNPNRSVPRDADNPTKNVADVVTQRDNLVALVKQVDLVDRWATDRPPVLRAKDALLAIILAPPSEDDKLRAIISVVEKKLTVTAEETSVTIGVDWSDPEMAYELASAVQKNFLDAKYDADVGMINDAIAILQKHLAVENDNVGTALIELRAAQDKAKAQGAAESPAAPPSPGVAPLPQGATRASAPVVSSRDSDLATLLEDRRTQIRKLQDAHEQRVDELNRQLQDALGTLTPAHPQVIALKARLEEAEKDPPELSTLKNDERAIVAQIAASASSAPAPQPAADKRTVDSPNQGASAAPAASVRPPLSRAEEDPSISVARYKLETATQKFAELDARIESARIELDVARAAFKYRFSVVHPAEFPRGPKKPNLPLLVLGGILASFFLAVAAAVIADLAGGKLLEPWQVRRQLKLPLLGEIDSP
jgi:uncharacterized protein involved in exopolysaccharide biosynthesis